MYTATNMMMSSTKTWVFLATASFCVCCDANISGDWSGACTLSQNGDPFSIQIDVSINEDVLKNIDGTSTLVCWDTVFNGYVNGFRNADVIVADAEALSGVNSIRVDLEGIALEDEIHGTCSFFGESGVVHLVRY